MELSVCLLLLVTAVVAIFGSAKADFCPDQNQTDEPKFTVKLGSVDYVRYSHLVSIPCCAEGYKNISWHKKQNGTWHSFPPYQPYQSLDLPWIREHGQVLEIPDAEEKDNGSYRCDVAGQTKVIHHTTDLLVVACDPLAEGPHLTSPFPENKTIYEYGGNITLPCTGYFGCRDPGAEQIIMWRFEGLSPDMLIENASSRYSVHYENRDLFTKMAQLTITSVRKEDVERTFFCILATPQEIKGQTRIDVKISKKEKQKLPWLLIGVIIGIVGFFILVFLFCLLLHCLYGPQIRLFCSSRISSLGPKTIDNEKYAYVYNLFIYHAIEDEPTAQEIKKYLTENGYRVYIEADMQGNENVMHTFFEKAAVSALVLFLYSDALRNDDLANFFLQALITERKGKDILFLEVADYKAEEIMDWALHAKDKEELERRIVGGGDVNEGDREENVILNRAEQRRIVGEGDVNEGDKEENVIPNGADGRAVEEQKGDAVKEKKVEIVDDLKFWNVLPRIKVPTDHKSERKMKNFYCSLQNKIPKFVDQKEKTEKRRKKRNSSQKPLLDSTRESEPLTPLSPVSDTGEISPNTDDVFRFEEVNEIEQNLPNEETVLINGDAQQRAMLTTNELIAPNENGAVRGETKEEIDNNLVYVADVHHNQSSEIPWPENAANSVDNNQQNDANNKGINEEAIANSNESKSKEDIFEMSGEEPKTRSFDSESGYSEENRSGRGTYPSSESDKNSHSRGLESQSSEERTNNHEGPSSQSSGFSDFNSGGSVSVSPPTALENVLGDRRKNNDHPTTGAVKPNGHMNRENLELTANGREKLNVKPQNVRNQSCASPESGYTTSPSEAIPSRMT